MGTYGTASGIVIGIDPADGKGKVLALTDGNIQASLSEDGLTWAGGKGRADNLGLRFDYDPATYWQFEADEWAALFTAAIATLDDDDDARFAGKFIQTGGQGDSGALRVLGSVTGIFAESESGRAISASSTYGIPLILYAGTGQGTDGRALVIMSGNVDGGGGRYTNMGNATVATDGLNRQTGDARYAGIAYTDHGALAGLGDDDHSQYLLATGARAGSTSQAQDFGATGIKADVVAESTAAAGVTVDGVLLKDGDVAAAALQLVATLLPTLKQGLLLSYSSATVVNVGIGAVVLNGRLYAQAAATTVAWADLDTGSEAVGTNYYVYAVLSGSALDFVISASATAPTGYTYYQLVGWFHNNPAGDISKYSIASGIDVSYPERGPKPGMVMLPGASWMIDIYIASNSGGTGLAVHSGNAAASAYNAMPWVSTTAFAQEKACQNAGKRLCTNEEWSMAAFGTPAGADNNTTCWTASGNTGSNPTGTLTGCVSTLGCYDMTGNVWERVSTWYDNTDVAADQAGWAYAAAWTNETEGGSAYTPFGANAAPDGYTGPRQWIRGGAWANSTSAGGWAAGANASPCSASSSISFRCCS